MSMSRRGYALSFVVAVSTLSISLPVGALRPFSSGPSRGESPTTRSQLQVPGQFSTIQAAINAADRGDTIQISAGTYVEQLTINKNLRLLGSGADENDDHEGQRKTADTHSTVIKAPTTLLPGSFGRTVIVDIRNGAKVTISNLTIMGPGKWLLCRWKSFRRDSRRRGCDSQPELRRCHSNSRHAQRGLRAVWGCNPDRRAPLNVYRPCHHP